MQTKVFCMRACVNVYACAKHMLLSKNRKTTDNYKAKHAYNTEYRGKS